MKKILIITIFFSLFYNSVFSTEPVEFVQSTVDSASQILSKNISKEEKIDAIKIIAKEKVDIRGIGFYSLGSARKNLNDNEKKNILNYLKIIF